MDEKASSAMDAVGILRLILVPRRLTMMLLASLASKVFLSSTFTSTKAMSASMLGSPDTIAEASHASCHFRSIGEIPTIPSDPSAVLVVH